MKLKLACADFTFPLLPHERVLELIAMLGFSGVDVGLFEDRSHLWPSGELPRARQSGRRLKRVLDGVGLQAADVFLQMANDFRAYAVNHPATARRAKARDWFQRTLEYADACGSRHVTILPGVQVEGESRATSVKRAAEELTWRVEQAEAVGLVLGIEAHIGSLVPTPEQAARLVALVPGLTLTLDYTHFTRRGMADDRVEPLIGLASHFHARGARRGRLQERFGRSTIDYRRICEVMQQVGYRGWIGVEYTWNDWEHCNECDNLSETILYRDFFRSLSR